MYFHWGFPLLVLPEWLKILNEANQTSTLLLVAVFGICFLMAFGKSAFHGYDRSDSIAGLVFLGLGLFFWIIGVVPVLTLIAAVFLAYVLTYWILWRFLFKNFAVGFGWVKDDTPNENPEPAKRVSSKKGK